MARRCGASDEGVRGCGVPALAEQGRQPAPGAAFGAETAFSDDACCVLLETQRGTADVDGSRPHLCRGRWPHRRAPRGRERPRPGAQGGRAHLPAACCVSHVRGRTRGSQERGTAPEADRLRHAPAGGRGRCARPWHRHQAAPSQKSHVRALQGAHAAAQTRRAKGLCSRGSEGHLRRRPLGGASGLITRAGPLSVPLLGLGNGTQHVTFRRVSPAGCLQGLAGPSVCEFRWAAGGFLSSFFSSLQRRHEIAEASASHSFLEVAVLRAEAALCHWWVLATVCPEK